MIMRFFLFLLLTSGVIFADLNITDKVSQIISHLSSDDDSSSKDKPEEDINASEKEKRIKSQKILDYTKRLEEINTYLKKNNMWFNVYSNHETYKSLEAKLKNLKSRIDSLEKKSKLTKKEEKALKKYKDSFKTTSGKIAQIKVNKDDPFKELLAPNKIGETPKILSPLNIIAAISFQKHLKAVEEDYDNRYRTLREIVSKLYEKNRILKRLVELKNDMNVSVERHLEEIDEVSKEIKTYNSNLEIFKTSQNSLLKDISDRKLIIKKAIKKEAEKGIMIGGTILFLLLIFFFIKYLVRKYMSENELFYTTNKALNFVFITIVFFILLFSYLENVNHLVSILGFASAGIAFALKDWFMSMMGWLVIIFSGSIHVGDRIKVSKDGNEYVGDVVDISILRMTLHEDVTLTTESLNRRAGRILFIPNNYIFTDIIANYSHSGLKTVWDGIDFTITFDSDVVKAQSIAKEVSRKYSKGYTDITRKQLNKLRSKYSMRNTSVEPRIFAFWDKNGVRISVWYLTNAYATLTLRSTISMEILSRIKEEEKVSIAFPSQSIYFPKELQG